MRTEYKHNPPIPYSLHDMRVKKIIIQDKTIVLEFEDGYEKLTKCERKAPKFIYGDISSLKNNDSISLFFIVLYF